jgi:hypothetical protein
MHIEWLKRGDNFLFTVAGPRRIFTGLPSKALSGI